MRDDTPLRMPREGPGLLAWGCGRGGWHGRAGPRRGWPRSQSWKTQKPPVVSGRHLQYAEGRPRAMLGCRLHSAVRTPSPHSHAAPCCIALTGNLICASPVPLRLSRTPAALPAMNPSIPQGPSQPRGLAIFIRRGGALPTRAVQCPHQGRAKAGDQGRYLGTTHCLRPRRPIECAA